MAKPALGAKTPDDAKYNGLITIHPDIVGMPRERRFAIVEYRTQKVETDIGSGEAKAHLTLVHVETPMTAAAAAKVSALLDELYLQRNPGEKSRPDPTAETDTPLEGLGDADDSVPGT